MSPAKKKKGNSSTRVAWTVVSIIAVIAIVIVVALFALGRGGSPTPATSTSAPVTVAPTVTPTVTPTPETLEQIQTNIVKMAAAHNGAGILGYMADKVQYLRFGSDGPAANLSPADAANQLTQIFGNETWAMTDADTVTAWKATPWPYFPDGSLQISSNQDHFVSFIFDNQNRITQMVYGTGASLN